LKILRGRASVEGGALPGVLVGELVPHSVEPVLRSWCKIL
jgi:hypothetical protein